MRYELSGQVEHAYFIREFCWCKGIYYPIPTELIDKCKNRTGDLTFDTCGCKLTEQEKNIYGVDSDGIRQQQYSSGSIWSRDNLSSFYPLGDEFWWKNQGLGSNLNEIKWAARDDVEWTRDYELVPGDRVKYTTVWSELHLSCPSRAVCSQNTGNEGPYAECPSGWEHINIHPRLGFSQSLY
jgi:hypothetical protein